MNNTQNHTELWRLEQLALVSQVATQVTSIIDLEELFIRVVGLIYQTFEFYVVSLYILEEDKLVLKAQAGPEGTFKAEDAYVPQERVEVPLTDGIVGWVAIHQQELVAGDVWQERHFRYSHEFPNTEAEVAVPLRVEDRVLGVLDVQLDYAENFDESDLWVLRALAGQISMAIEDTRLYAAASRRGDYLATISAVSWAIASILDVDELLEQVSQLIRKYFDYPVVQLFTVHYGRRQVEYRAGSGQTELPPQGYTYDLHDLNNAIAFVAQTGQSRLINPDTPDRVDAMQTMLPGIKSELAVPLMYNEKVLGVLDIQAEAADAFDEEDQTIIDTLAANIAVALRNANLYHSERWRHQVANSLRRISGTLITDVDLTYILDSILSELKRNLPADILAIWLISHTQKEVGPKLQLSTVQTAEPFQLPATFDPEQDPWLGLGLEAIEPLLRKKDHPADPIASYLGYKPDHSAVVAPLRVQNRMLGLLTLVHNEARRYGRETRAITTAFANQAAIAIENARLFHVAQEEAQINSALLKVAEMTQGLGDLKQVLAAVTQIPPLMAEVDRCAIWLRQADHSVFAPEAAFGFSPATLQFFESYVINSDEVVAAARLVQTRAPLIVTAAAEDRRLPADLVSGLGLNTLALLPIVAHGDILGLMLVTFVNSAMIRAESIRLVTGVAHQAAVAIESKYLFDRKAKQEQLARELELARSIQANLIPTQLAAPAGWEVAALWQSAQEVSGDFYDFVEVDPDHWGIVIGDVAGKGMPAALYMGLTRSFIRATAPGQTDPSAVLVRTNQLLVPDTHGGMFVSLFYGIINTQTGQLTYANAGHNPPLLIRHDGCHEVLHVPGPVLGVQTEIEPKPAQNQLGPGDGIVFYTDGVIEVFNNTDELFGTDRLTSILQQNWSKDPRSLVTQIYEAVYDFSGATMLNDDFTLLILRRN